MIRTHIQTTHRRRGNILIVVLLMLALFATIGLTIVYYTKDLSERQRINIEANSTGGLSFPDDGSTAFNLFLSNWIYDTPTPSNGSTPNNAIWGHSLVRTMYGGIATPGVNSAANSIYPVTAMIPWSGVGSFHEAVAAANGLDRVQVVNLAGVWANGGTIYPEISNNGSYVPKNAPYTYPDLKDFYLASIVPATGEVLTPSFYRSYLFRGRNQPATATGLEPNNRNWTDAYGRYMSVRPRPADQVPKGSTQPSAFPYPPPNADGTYTGDVQNLTGSFVYNSTSGQWVAHNDSIWVDIGMAPMTLLNGKTVKPLVAPLIIDLDSLLNYNVHGNPLGGPSGAGMGPWEVNLTRAFPTDGGTLVTTRGTPKTASGITSKSFANVLYQASSGSQQLPAYSAVPWGAGAGAGPNSLILYAQGAANTTGTMLATSPTTIGTVAYPQPTYSTLATPPTVNTGYDSTDATIVGHPALWNPGEWASGIGGTQSFPNSDLSSLIAQYCAPPSTYTTSQLSLNGASPASSIRGQQGTTNTAPNPSFVFPVLPYPQQPATGNFNALNINSYRLDPANINRGILTPYSWSLDRPGLSPNFQAITQNNALTLNPGSILTGGTFTGVSGAFPNTGNPGGAAISDFTSKTQLSNARAALGPMDLNRTLTDYRANTSLPLSPTNMAPAQNTLGTGATTYPQAVIDRQQMAMSIFVRLVVASGADASYQVISGVGESISFPNGPPAANTPAFNALRELAQIAANIVDYIDSDDISTAFVWNPINTSDPLNPINFQTANLGNSVVFGVERPRLVLNEAYGEIVNNPADPTFQPPTPPNKLPQPAGQGQAGNPQIRFFLELLNPGMTSYSTAATTTNPLGTGAVTVNYQGQFNPYQIQIVRSSLYPLNGNSLKGVSGLLRDPTSPGNLANVTGGLGQVGVTPDITFNFEPLGQNTPTITINPANGSAATQNSMLILAANVPKPPQGGPDLIFPINNTNGSGLTNFTPTGGAAQYVLNATAPVNGQNGAPGGALSYESLSLAQALPNNGGNGVRADLQNHVVLLQRLANPYTPPSTTNPYITVDYMDYVPAADRILRANGSRNNRQPYTKGGAGATGFNPTPSSLGKVQPYAGWTGVTGQAPSPNTYQNGATGGTYNFTFPTSLVLPQTAPYNQQPTPGSNATAVQNTFGQFNSSTPMTIPTTPTYQPTTLSATKIGRLLNQQTNSTDTLMTPFDWLTHLDRPLINQSELLQVATGKPHELTQRFIVPNAIVNATDVNKYNYMLSNTLTSNVIPLVRALDVLRIQPYGQMTALGGRVPGRINLNTVQDKRVWDSTFDAQSWNSFIQTDVTTMWTQMIGSRTTAKAARYDPTGAQLMDTASSPYSTPIPGASVYDTTKFNSGAVPIVGTDRPFLPLGAPTFTAGNFAYVGGSSLQTDTLVRTPNGSTVPYITTASNSGVNSPPYNYSSVTGSLMAHPYVYAEAFRKITNNTNTVSHTFAVWVTVGYFDYNPPSANSTPVLGAEYYSTIPGDLRRKYFAIVDRSMIGLEPQSVNNYNTNYASKPTQANLPVHSQNLPFFTTVDGTAVTPAKSTTIPITTSATGTGMVFSNGSSTYIQSQIPTNSSWISIGTGATQEMAMIMGVLPTKNQTVNGATLVTLMTPLQYPHWPGECVSNIVPGNPGPQLNATGQLGNFNYAQTPYSYIVPFTSRLQ